MIGRNKQRPVGNNLRWRGKPRKGSGIIGNASGKAQPPTGNMLANPTGPGA
jgi:hypothetical protein